MVQFVKHDLVLPPCDGRSEAHAQNALEGAEHLKFDKAAARAEQARLLQQSQAIDLLTTGLGGLESLTRFIRDGSLIVGEHVAMRLGGPVGSAGFRLVVGSASSLAEEGMSVAFGLKTLDQGFSDLSWAVTQNSLSAVTDLGGGKLAGMVAKKIGGEISRSLLSKVALGDQARSVVMTTVGNIVDALTKTVHGEAPTASDFKHYALNYGTSSLLAAVGTKRNFHSTNARSRSDLVTSETGGAVISTVVSLVQAHIEGGITPHSFLSCLSNGGIAYANVRHGLRARNYVERNPHSNSGEHGEHGENPANSYSHPPTSRTKIDTKSSQSPQPSSAGTDANTPAASAVVPPIVTPHITSEIASTLGAERDVPDVAHVINSRQVLVHPSDVEKAIEQFPADQRAVATHLIAHTAETGSYHGLNQVMEQLTTMGVRRDGALIVDNGPGSITDAMRYLHNRNYLQSYQNIPTNARQDADHRRLVGENFRVPNYYTHVDLPEGQAVLVLDHHALTKFNSTAQGQNQLLKMLEDPKVSLLVPVGRNLGTQTLHLSPETSTEALKPVVADAHRFMSEGFGVADAMNLSLIKHDPVIQELRALDPRLLQRTQLVGLVKTDDATSRQPHTPDEIAHTLSGKPRALTSDALQKLHDQCPTALQPQLLMTLDEQASIVTIPEMRQSLSQVHEQIQARADGREIFYLVPEGGKSFGLVAHMMKETDPTIRPDQIVRPQDLAERLAERDQRWSRDVRKLGRAAGPRPDHSSEVVVVILDDFAGSGRSLGRAVDSARTLLQDPETHSPILYHGEVIVAPLFMTSGAEHAIRMDENKRDRGRISIITGRVVQDYTHSQSYAAAPTETFEVHGGIRNLGYEDGGLVFALPYTGPNNNSLLGKWVADQMLPKNAAKPPHGATHKTYTAYLNDQKVTRSSAQTPLREFATREVSSQ